MQEFTNKMCKLSINSDNKNYINLINHYNSALFLKNNNLYNYKFFKEII